MMPAPPRQTKVIGFSISIAAERTGMHPQTLREYERKGLVLPQRTQGGARRYRDEEVERLRRIQELTEQGLSLAGVAYVLRLEDEVRGLKRRVGQLEQALAEATGEPAPPPADPPAPPAAGGDLLPVRRTISVEIVHVPRSPRSPRWRNDGH